MTVGVATLMLAAALKVALPAFDVQQLPGVISQRLPDIYSHALEEQRCAVGLSAGLMGPQAAAEIINCDHQPSCVSLVGRVLGVRYVTLGQVRKLDSSYLIQLSVVDVKEQRVTARVEHRHEGKITEFEKSVREQIGSLCKAVNPEWVEPKPGEPRLEDLSFEVPTITVKKVPEPTAPAKPAKGAGTTAPAGFEELPPLPEEKVATAKPAPVAPLPASALVLPAERTPDPAKAATVAPTKPKRFPWAIVAGGGALAALGVGIGLGNQARVMWGADRQTLVNGVTVHSMSHVEADHAMSYARAANVMFVTAGALAVTSGVLFITQGGFGFSGRF